MGVFKVKLRFWKIGGEPGQATELELMVDTGATYSWISRGRLEALGIRSTRRMQFRTIEGRMIERDVAPVLVAFDGYSGADNVVMAEPGELEVMGAFTLEGLGLAADVVQQKLVPTIGLALSAVGSPTTTQRSRSIEAIDAAIKSGRLVEPFSNGGFLAACPGFGGGTYNPFLWKHSCGNPSGLTGYVVPVGANRFRRRRD
jgi:predicted aspartyl protease